MAQTVFGLRSGEAFSFSLPDAKESLLKGIKWGRHDEFFTPAYWAAQTILANFKSIDHRLGKTLKEEAAACLLGGHGITAEMGLAAFDHLRSLSLLEGRRSPRVDELYNALAAPLRCGDKVLRYRFARQKAAYLAPLLAALDRDSPDFTNHIAFRNWFLAFKGIGPKTASWIARNWLGSNEVAILDIHIHRAGLICGFFSPHHKIERHYFEMEQAFVQFANALNVAPSHLDAVIWIQMKEAGNSIFPLVRAVAKFAA